VPPHLVASVVAGCRTAASDLSAVTASWARTRAMSWTWAGPGFISLLGRANNAGPQAKSWLILFPVSVFVFRIKNSRKSSKFLKYIENGIKLRKLQDNFFVNP
jgi:hypothetical protein